MSVLHQNGLGKLPVDGVPTVFDGNGAASLTAGYHGDGLTAVAAQREEKGIQLRVVGEDAGDDIFFSGLCAVQINKLSGSLLGS